MSVLFCRGNGNGTGGAGAQAGPAAIASIVINHNARPAAHLRDKPDGILRAGISTGTAKDARLAKAVWGNRYIQMPGGIKGRVGKYIFRAIIYAGLAEGAFALGEIKDRFLLAV